MKIISAFVLILMMAKGCTSSELKKEGEHISFEYEASTRGNYFKTLVKQDTVINIKGRKGVAEQKNLPKKDWNSVLKEVEKIDPAKIETMKPPSNKRFHDGAMMAVLKIIYKEKTYQTETFDHGNPPSEIKPLVDRILKVSDVQKTEE